MTRSIARRPLLVLVIAGAVAGAVATRWWTFLDLTVYRFGGRTVLDGLPVYAAGEPHSGLWLVLALAGLAAYELVRAGRIRPATSPSVSRPPSMAGAE